jgi:CubicO group peptidase (beta-lactamase class C family)
LSPDVRMPERGRAITLRDLADHTSGLPRLPGNLFPIVSCLSCACGGAIESKPTPGSAPGSAKIERRRLRGRHADISLITR